MACKAHARSLYRHQRLASAGTRRNSTHFLIAIGRTFWRLGFRAGRATGLSDIHAFILLRVALAAAGKFDARTRAAGIGSLAFARALAGSPRSALAAAIGPARKHRAGSARAATLAAGFAAFSFATFVRGKAA